MPKKGIKQIKHTGGKFYQNMSNDKICVIAADSANTFVVSEWEKDTSENDKAKVKWMLEDGDRKKLLMEFGDKGPQVKTLSIPAALCGANNKYYLEAVLGDATINWSTNTGMLVRGYCTPAVVSSSWQDTNRKPLSKDKPISYGDKVLLHVQTQGLCNSNLIVKVYHTNWGKDTLVDTFADVTCPEGEVNYVIGDTSAWYHKLSWGDIGIGEFYVTIEAKEVTGLVKDTTQHGDTAHARFLRIKNELLNTNIVPSKNITPVRLGDNTLKVKRYDPCAFTRIEINDQGDRVVLFDEDQLKLRGAVHKDFDVTEKIYYDFAKWAVRADAKVVMDKIADFLLQCPYVPVELGSHTDSIGGDKFNMDLSEKRAKAAVDYLIQKGVDKNRISAKGYGKTMLVLKGDHLTKDQQQVNRRTTLKYKIFENDSQALIYQTIAPDSTLKRKLDFTVKDFSIDGCIHVGDHKHTKDVKIVMHTRTGDKNDTPHTIQSDHINPQPEVFADLTYIVLTPLVYLWPIACTTNNFMYYINTCRYFSDKTKPSVLVRVYPDIKWTFAFELDLTEPLSVKGSSLTPAQLKDLQSKAGKIGAEKRWKQKDASWKLSLRSDWNGVGGDYKKNKVYETKEFDFKFKTLYSLFSSVGNMAEGITNKTKGLIKSFDSLKNSPVTFEMLSPKVKLLANWYLKRAHRKNRLIEKVGTQLDFRLTADPLIGLQMTIDLLGLAVASIATAVSDGAATEEVMTLYGKIKDGLSEGVDVGDDGLGIKASADIYINLTVSSAIYLKNFGFTINTESDNSDTKLTLETTAQLKLEISAGVNAKAEIAVAMMKADAYFEISGKGTASVTFGHSLNATEEGLFYHPQLGFDGVDVQYTISIKYALSAKKLSTGKHNVVDEHGVIKGLVPKFDVVKSLEELSGVEFNFYIFKNDNA